MMRVAAITLLVASTAGGPAAAGNAACWGDDERQDITCAKITEQLVRGLIGASKAKLDATMGVNGIRVSGDTWHFMSNFDYGRTIGSGFINFVIADGVVRAIFGAVGSDNPKLLFDGKTNFKFRLHAGDTECSDAPGWGSFSPCPR
jgi:hypothetical protein